MGGNKSSVDRLAHSLAKYCDLLVVKSRTMNNLHAFSVPTRSISSDYILPFVLLLPPIFVKFMMQLLLLVQIIQLIWESCFHYHTREMRREAFSKFGLVT